MYQTNGILGEWQWFSYNQCSHDTRVFFGLEILIPVKSNLALPKDVQKLYNADAEKSDSFCGSSHLKTSWCVTGSWVLWVLCEHNSGMIELKWDMLLLWVKLDLLFLSFCRHLVSERHQ